MKKIISIILAIALMLAAIPALGAEEQPAPLAGRTSDMKRIGDSTLLWSMDAMSNFVLYSRSYDGRSVEFDDIGIEYIGEGGTITITITDAEESDTNRDDEFYNMLNSLGSSVVFSAADLITDDYGNEAYRFIFKEKGTNSERGYVIYKVWANGYIYDIEATIRNLDKFSLNATAAQIATFTPVFGDSSVTYDLAADPDTTFNKFASADLGISFDIPLYIDANDAAASPSIIALFSQKADDATEIYISVCSLSDTVSAEALAKKTRDFEYERSNHDCVEMSEVKPVDVSCGENAFEYTLTYSSASGETKREYTQLFEKGDYCYLINIMYDDSSALLPETVMNSFSVTGVDADKIGYVIPTNLAAFFPEDVTYTVSYVDGKSLTVPRTWRYADGYLTEIYGAQISAEDVTKSSGQTIAEYVNESFEDDIYLNTVVSPVTIKALGEREYYMYTYSSETGEAPNYYTVAFSAANEGNTIYKFTLKETERYHSEKAAENFESMLASMTIEEAEPADSSNNLGISLDLPANFTHTKESRGELSFSSDTTDNIQISVYSAENGVSSATLAEKSRARSVEYLNAEYVNITDIAPLADVSYGENAFTYSITAVKDDMWNEYFCFFEKGSYCYMIEIDYSGADLPNKIMSSLSVEELDPTKYGTLKPSNFSALFPEQSENKISYDGIMSFDLPSAWWADDNSTVDDSGIETLCECIVGAGIYIVGIAGDTESLFTPELIDSGIEEWFKDEGVTLLQPFEYKTYGANTVYIGTMQIEGNGMTIIMTVAFTDSCMIGLMDFAATYGGQTMTDFEKVLSSLVIAE